MGTIFQINMRVARSPPSALALRGSSEHIAAWSIYAVLAAETSPISLR